MPMTSGQVTIPVASHQFLVKISCQSKDKALQKPKVTNE